MIKAKVYSPLSFFIGNRYVKTRHGHGFSSFISASSTFGIGLGVMVLIIVLSAMNGFERELANRLLSIVPHGEFTAVNEPIANWQEQLDSIEQHPDVVASAPVIKQSGMVQKGDQVKALEVRGVDINRELQVSSIGQYLPLSDWQKLELKNAIVIGDAIAKKLKVKQGDIIQLLLPRNNHQNSPTKHQQKSFVAPLKVNLEVVGIFKFGGSLENSLAYISLENAAEILSLDDKVTGLRIKMLDVFNAQKVVRQVSRDIKSYVYIEDWTRTQGHLFNDIQLVRMVMFIVLVLVIAVASFNIVSTLIMAVNDRKGDIAILKTMGAKNTTIMMSFVYQGLFNGILGTFIGAVLGTLIASNLTEIIRTIENGLGVSFLTADVYFVDFMPTMLRASDVLVTVVSALVLTVLATLYPAWRATKIEPAKVLGSI